MMKKEILQNRKGHRRLVCKLRGKDTVNVVFIVSSLTMWQHQGVYELMTKDSHFHTTIIFAPFLVYSEEENRRTLIQLRQYFGERHTPFLVYEEMDFSKQTFREQYAPDILFYPQWYSGLYDANIDITSFFDRLVCLIPYGICITKGLFCNLDGNNYAWKQYQTSPMHLEISKKVSESKGDNMVIVGYPKGDIYAQPVHQDPWKLQMKQKKRVIWAPHFTITQGITPLHRSHFLQMAEYMWELATSYQDTVQFAFKPHPRLLTELYKHEDWGPERTDAYYQRWADGENTQLETGDYTELFKTSDGMVHDCGSFSVEYLYVHKPVMFISEDPEQFKVTENLSDFGSAAMDVHYIGSTEADIRTFIEQVVMAGDDSKKPERDAFVTEQLCQPEGVTTAQLIFNDICRELWIETDQNPLCLWQKVVKLWCRLLG